MDENTVRLLQPIVESVTMAALTVIGGWIAYILQTRAGIAIEQHHKDNLHSALLSGVRAAFEKLGATGDPKAVAQMAIQYARKSVPDALNKLNPPPEVMSSLADSKVQQVQAEEKMATAPAADLSGILVADQTLIPRR